MRAWMIGTLGLALVASVAAQNSSPSGSVPAWEPAPAALAEKAPGRPPCGLILTRPTGKLLLTGLGFDPDTRKPSARLYRIQGPAGWGPYRSGLEQSLSHTPAQPRPAGNDLHFSWYQDHFTFSTPEKGTAAEQAGLEQSKLGLTRIDRVDGSTYNWNAEAMVYHITQDPAVARDTGQPPLFSAPRHQTRHTPNPSGRPPATEDATLVFLTPDEETRKWLSGPTPWQELLKLRSQSAPYAPLPLDLAGQKRWVVLVPGQPARENQPRVPGVLEIWREDPLSGAFETGLLACLIEPPDGFQPGRALLMGDAWHRLQTLARDPATSRLAQVGLQPWKADIPMLLDGTPGSRELGSLPSSQLQESMEQRCNDALIEWKTRSLPPLLATQDLGPAEELVIRIEKGVLALDLEAKAIRSRLDAATRAEAERRAQAELAAKEGKAVSPAQAAPATESERLADLLDQRKAILMAVLGSAKQALANLRR